MYLCVATILRHHACLRTSVWSPVWPHSFLLWEKHFVVFTTSGRLLTLPILFLLQCGSCWKCRAACYHVFLSKEFLWITLWVHIFFIFHHILHADGAILIGYVSGDWNNPDQRDLTSAFDHLCDGPLDLVRGSSIWCHSVVDAQKIGSVGRPI